MEPWSRRTVLLGLAGVTGGVLAGCASKDPTIMAGPPRPTPSPSPTPTPVEEPRWPLTGKPLSNPSKAKRAAVAVKVPDNQNEHPQVGINEADIVFVQLDGYVDSTGQSATRLMPVYHSKFPEGVGPVRSIRPVDVPALAPIHAVIASTGAAAWVEKYANMYPDFVDASTTYMNTKGTGSFSIDPSRVRVYQGQKKFDRAVLAHPRVLSENNKTFADGPPQLYFPFAGAEDPVSTESGKPAASVVVPWKRGGQYAMSYEYDEEKGRYLRSMPWGPHVLKDGSRVTTDNIMIILAGQRWDKLIKGGGGKEPIHEIENGVGGFYYAHGGKYVTGTWTKGEVQDPFEFTLDDGSPLYMAPGRTFVELADTDAEVKVS